MYKIERNLKNAYERGACDCYYGRPPKPKMWLDSLGIKKLQEDDMTQDEIASYFKGFEDEDKYGSRKEW